MSWTNHESIKPGKFSMKGRRLRFLPQLFLGRHHSCCCIVLAFDMVLFGGTENEDSSGCFIAIHKGRCETSNFRRLRDSSSLPAFLVSRSMLYSDLVLHKSTPENT